MTEDLISNKVATEQFNLILDYYDIDLEDYDNSDEDNNVGKVIKGLGKKVIRAIRKGYLKIDMREGRMFVIQHLRCDVKKLGKVLEYKPVNGKSRTAMNGIPSGDSFEKLLAVAASLTGNEKSAMLNIEGPDLGLLENICSLFLLV
ncbi:MAG: hypothetical protein ACTSPB_12890 [Candidatus Thorarchaeota archaeon]